MEVSPLTISGVEDWHKQFTAALHNQRDRVREFLSVQQDRLCRAEKELAVQLEEIAAELDEDRKDTRRTQEELARWADQLKGQSADLEQMKAELDARQAEWEGLYRRTMEQQQAFVDQLKQQGEDLELRRQDALEQQSAAAAAETKLQRERKATEAEQAELESQQTQLHALRDSLQTQQAELEKQRAEVQSNFDSLQDRQAELDDQRNEYQSLLDSLKTKQEDLENQGSQLGSLRDTLKTQQAELEKRQQEVEARTSETKSQRRRIARELKAQRAVQQKELELHRMDLEQAGAAEQRELQRELESLREQCRVLRDNPRPGAEVAQDAEEEDYEDGYRSRFKQAIEELNELKASNEELQRQLNQLRSGSGAGLAHISAGSLNWEAEKLRILTALEADFDEQNEEEQEEKLEIEQVLRKTDRIVAERNREISELRGLLESQTKHLGSVAIGAEAVGQIVDTDDIIKEERIKLKRMQDECSEKLRRAEVEISLERAKIARDRTQVEEKIRILEQQHGPDALTAKETKEQAKPARGRWLAKLGLSDPKEEQDKQ